MILNPFKLIFLLNRLLVKIESLFLGISLMGLLFFAFLQVFLRNVMDSGIHWADVFNRLLVLWIGFFGATLAAQEDRHLSLELLTKFMPAKYKPIVDLFVKLFVVIVTFLLTHAAWLFFQDQITYESTALLFEGLPIAYFTVVFPVGFGLLCFHFFVKFLETIYVFAGGDLEYLKANPSSSCEPCPNVTVNININQSQVVS